MDEQRGAICLPLCVPTMITLNTIFDVVVSMFTAVYVYVCPKRELASLQANSFSE